MSSCRRHTSITVTVRGRDRCGWCGHRVAVAGVAPGQTRDQMLAHPAGAARIAWRELLDRRSARRRGQDSGQQRNVA
jgi:hypothetical protein